MTSRASPLDPSNSRARCLPSVTRSIGSPRAPHLREVQASWPGRRRGRPPRSPATRLARDAGVAAVQDQPVVGLGQRRARARAAISCASTLSGSCRRQPVRWETRKTWVSTAMGRRCPARSAPRWRSCGRRRAGPAARRGSAAPRRRAARAGAAQRDDVPGLAAIQADRGDVAGSAPPRPAPASSAGVSATLNSLSVALLTRPSVAWAERTTATTRV